jgi:microcystin-dependent protein
MNRRGFLKTVGLTLVAASPVGAAVLKCVKPAAPVIAAPAAVPAGTVMATAASTVPEGWMVCDGTFITPMEYPALYAALTSGWGGKPKEVRVPDFRGIFNRIPTVMATDDGKRLHFNVPLNAPIHIIKV